MRDEGKEWRAAYHGHTVVIETAIAEKGPEGGLDLVPGDGPPVGGKRDVAPARRQCRQAAAAQLLHRRGLGWAHSSPGPARP
jgi:hypothetical protein